MIRLMGTDMRRAAGSGALRPARSSPLPRLGFTLVEMLVTITIIGILATMSMAALRAVQQSAKADRTKATINKINNYVSEQYESYRTRRLPISFSAFTVLVNAPQNRPGARLDVLRDLIRMEMPDRWSDVANVPLTFAWTGGGQWLTSRPAVTEHIRTRYVTAYSALVANGKTATQATDILARYASAKLLYMVVTLHDRDAVEHFRSDEVAIVTEDNLPVFVDAWGNPIQWIRWAPGFDQSDIQSQVSPIDDATKRLAASLDPNNRDPLNPNNVFRSGALVAPVTTESGTPSGSTVAIPIGWKLTPLIYSAGPDGVYDIYDGDTTYNYAGNPYVVFTAMSPVCSLGSPRDQDNHSVTAEAGADGVPGYYDNITNHQAEVK